jgi:hypothetical protein
MKMPTLSPEAATRFGHRRKEYRVVTVVGPPNKSNTITRGAPTPVGQRDLQEALSTAARQGWEFKQAIPDYLTTGGLSRVYLVLEKEE